MAEKLTVLVTGATGQQGGALARLLLRRGHKVRAFTRNANSDAAQALARAGAEVMAGHLEDPAAVASAARGADAVFSVTTPFEAGMAAEVAQGVAVADAAKAAGVRHLLFTSVPKADTHTGIPHFDTKMEVERHMRNIAVPFTIIGPSFFMENLLSPWWLPALRQGQFVIALPPTRKLQLIALQDIAGFAALVLENRDEFLGRRIDIAGDERTCPEIAAVLARATGRNIEYVQQPIEQVRAWSEDFALMFEWFDRGQGTGIDVAALYAKYPGVGWHSFEQWAGQQSWEALKKPGS
jgi:uncharacterized protein YbjT (DUF2867 family)